MLQKINGMNDFLIFFWLGSLGKIDLVFENKVVIHL